MVVRKEGIGGNTSRSMREGISTRSILESGRSRLGEWGIIQTFYGRLFFSRLFVRRYFSPYPLFEEDETSSAPGGRAQPPVHKIHNVARTTQRSHGRTADMLAGGLGREGSEDTPLWVCDRCFKYMKDGRSLKLHTVCSDI